MLFLCCFSPSKSSIDQAIKSGAERSESPQGDHIDAAVKSRASNLKQKTTPLELHQKFRSQMQKLAAANPSKSEKSVPDKDESSADE